MLSKLAFRNVRRSARDYLVYFLTMAVVAALMFAFNSLMFSKDIQNRIEAASMIQIMLGLATFFIVLIVAWLIHYMVRFILEKRSKEFGIYLLIGMQKQKIAGLYMSENILLGAGAFLVGMALGMLFQQILLSVFYSMIQIDYRLHLECNSACILMTVCCYGGCYLLALMRCRRKLKKMNICDLMNSQKQNEGGKECHEKEKRLLFPLSLLFFVVFGGFLFFYKNWDTGSVVIFLVGLVVTIYLFYTGIAAWISCYVRKKGKMLYQGANLFLLRQFSSKVRTMRFTMGTLTSLFTLALLGSAVALMFNDFQNQILVNKFPFDVQIYSSRANEDFHQEIALLEKETQINEIYRYQIYQNGTNQVNAWLYTHLKTFGSDYRKADGTPDWECIDQNDAMVYCDYDTYMGLSDYNHLRKMLGLSEIRLEEGEYAIHIKERVLHETGDFSNDLEIKDSGGRRLSFAGYHREGFSQDGHNGGDYILIVPDSVIAGMTPYYAELAADLAGDAPADLQNKLDDLETDGQNVDSLGHVKTEAVSDDWEAEEKGNSCTGSDTIVVYVAKNLVRDNLIPEIKYMLSSIIFPLFYIGLVFLCVALTVLSVQQLSDSAKYRFRYRVLSQIGCSGKEISGIIRKQLLAYYLCPALVALFIGGVITVYTGMKFQFYTGVHTGGILYFLMSAALFFGIYLVYFLVTYVGFKRNVEKE